MSRKWFRKRSTSKKVDSFRKSNWGWLLRSPRAARGLPLSLEVLEERSLLTANNWISAGSGNWNVPANWSAGHVPTSTEDVVINTAAVATITIQAGDTETPRSVTTAATDTLAFTGGSLTVTASSPLSGPLTMTAGTITANGAGITVTASGTTTITDGNLTAQGGATFALPNLTTYKETSSTVFQATGANSTLNLSGLVSLGNMTNFWQVEALNGGSLNLSGLTTINQPNANVQLQSDGTNSQIALGALTSFTGGGGSSTFQVTHGGSITATHLTSFTNVGITLDGSGTVATSQWAAITGGSRLTITGGTFNLPGLTNLDGADILVQGGASATLPDLVHYTETDSTIFEASGVNSTLNVSALTTLGNMTSFWQVEALAGGTVNLTGLAVINQPNANIQLIADGAGSQLNLSSSLTSYTGGGGSSTFQDTNGGAIAAPNLATFNNVTITVDGSGTVATNQWATITASSRLIVTGGTFNFSGLTNLDDAGVFVQNGGSATLSSLVHYTETDSTIFEATGVNSTLNVSALTTLGNMTSFWQVEALAGGTVNLTGLAVINQPNANIQLIADGAGSQLNLSSSLTSFTGGGGSSSFQDTNGGAIAAPNLATFNNVTIMVDGSGTVATNQWATITASSRLIVTGGTFNFSGLTNLDDAGVFVQNGGSATLSSLVHYTETDSTIFEATGVNSTLNVSALTTLGNMTSFWQVEALAGGTVNLTRLATINQPSANIQLIADGAGSQLNLSSSLTSFTGGGGSSTFQDTNGATISAPHLAAFSNITITLDGSGSTANNQWATITGDSRLILTGGTVSLPALTDLDSAGLLVQNGGSLTLPNLTHYTETTSTLFEANGVNSNLNVSALTTLGNMTNFWQVQAFAGGTVNLTGLATINQPNANVQLNADGAGSQLNLSSSLTSFTGGGGSSTFQDTNGATITASHLATFNNINVTLDGTGTVPVSQWTTITGGGSLTVTGGTVTLPGLTNLDNANLTMRDGASLTLGALAGLTGTNISDTGSSSLITPKLATLSSVGVNTDGTDSTLGSAWATFAQDTLQVTAGTLTLPALTSLSDTNLLMNNGAGISLTNAGIVTIGGSITLSAGTLSISGPANLSSLDLAVTNGATLHFLGTIGSTGLAILEATGGSSLVSVGAGSLAESTTPGSVLLIEAFSGARVDLSSVTSISGGPVVLESNGSNSVINLLGLQSFTSVGGVLASSGGAIQANITLPAAPDIWIATGSGSWDNSNNWLLGSTPAAGMNALINTATPATISLFAGDNISIQGLTLGANDTLSVGGGSKLTMAGNFTNNGALTLLPGGKVVVGGNETQSAGAIVNEQIGGIPSSGLFGTIAVTGKATLAGTFNLALVNQFTPTIGQDFPVITFGSVSGNFSTFTGLGQSLSATLKTNSLDLIAHPSPPVFTADTPPTAGVGSAYSYQFQASGTGPITFSASGLPNWASLNTSTGVLSGTPPTAGTFNFTVTATNGIAPDATANISLKAQLQPPVFTSDTPPSAIAGSPFSYQFQATGTGTTSITYSATGLPNWAQINANTGVLSGTPPMDGTFSFSVTASNGIAPDTSVNVSIVAAGGTNQTFDIAAGTTFAVPNGIYAGGTTFNLGANARVTISAGTFTGGAVFNVAPGSVVDLTGGGTPTFSGTMTGSDGGTVLLGSGRMFIGAGGLTMAFAGNTFQWTGGQMDAGLGDLTNVGTMNITGNSEKDFYNDGLLDNFGTIIQTGSGNLQLGTDGRFAATLKNEPGASYLFQGDGGLSEISDSGSATGQTSLDNAGLIRKTVTSGISNLNVLGSITNTGTIEVDTGTVALKATLGIAQIVSGSLNAGAWSAQNGAHLQLPASTSITTNAASLALGGSGATISGIAGLTTNNGSFAITGGANFTTAGAFTNSGKLTVGAASKFTVAGALTETAKGALNFQIADAPASGQFGLAAVSGAATLAGSIQVTPINGFTGAPGQDFKVLTFGSATGSFSAAIGFGSTFSQTLSSTALDLFAFKNPADLQVTSVTSGATATSGMPLTVNWQVADLGPSNPAGNWQDSVYLSTTPSITPNSVLLGSAQHTGGVSTGTPYNGALTATVPALAPGSYFVLVQSDSLYQVSDPARANNILSSSSQISLSLPALTLGVATNDAFTAASQDHYYHVTVPAGGTLNVSLNSSAASGATALYVSRGQLPTPSNADFTAAVNGQPAQTALVPQVLVAGTYYILAHSVSGAAATSAFTLTAAQSSSLAITSIPNVPSGNGGNATVEIDGANFAPNATASLNLGATTINASSVQFLSASKLVAVFNLNGVAIGNYTLKVQQGAQTASANSAFQVVAATTGNPLDLQFTTPALVRAGRGGTIQVTATNLSNNDIPAPLLILSSDAANLNLPSNPAFASSSLTFLAASSTGIAGTLTAGESVTVVIDFVSTTTNANINFQLAQADLTRTFDYSQIAAGLVQNNVANSASALTFLENEVGPTWGDYAAMLDRNANLIPAQLGSPNDFKALFNIEFNKALAAVTTSISGTIQGSHPGLSLGGLSVFAIDKTSGATFAAITLNDGSFTFPNLPASTYTFSVTGVSLISTPTVNLNAGQALTGVTLAADQGAQISGRVQTQDASPAAIAGALLQARNETTGLVFSTTSDSSGNYTFAGLPAGIYDLVINAAGFARAEIAGVDLTLNNATQPIALTTQSTIGGTIVLGSGGPAESTLVVTAALAGSIDPNQTFSTFSTSTSFLLAQLPAGTYTVTVKLPGYVTQTFTSQVVAASANLDLGTINLIPVASIAGTLLPGSQQVSVSDTLIDATQNGQVIGTAYTDASGKYTISNLAPGAYTITAVLPGVIADQVSSTVAAGVNQTGVNLTLHPGGVIQGIVTATSDGQALQGMVVSLLDPSGNEQATFTDANGAYSFTGLAAGSYTVFLSLSAANNVQTVTVADLNGTPVQANFTAPTLYDTRLEGLVLDAAQNPIASAQVSLIQNGAIVATVGSAADGSYTFLLAQGGTYSLQVDALSGGGTFVSGVAVTSHSTLKQNLTAGTGSLVVNVSDAHGPLANVPVQLFRQLATGLAVVGNSLTNASGQVSFAGLSAGTYVAESGASGEAAVATTTVVAGSNPNLNLNLTASLSLSGTITDASSQPVANATITLFFPTSAAQSRTVYSDASGKYNIPSFLPGTYDLVVTSAGNQTLVLTGQSFTTSQTLNEQLAASTTTIQGQALDAAGNPVPAGAVTVRDAAGHLLGFATTGPTGAFQLKGIVGTNLIITVSANGYAPAKVTNFTVSSGGSPSLGTLQLTAAAVGQIVSGVDPGPGTAPAIGDQSFGSSLMELARAALGQNVQTLNVSGPNCPNCVASYSAFVQADQSAVQFYNGVVKQAAQQMIDDATRLIAADYAETAILAAKVAAVTIPLIPFSAASSGFVTGYVYAAIPQVFSIVQAILSDISLLNTAPSGTAIGQFADVVSQLINDIKNMVLPLNSIVTDPSKPGLLPPWLGPISLAVTSLISDPYAASRQWGLALDTDQENYQKAQQLYQQKESSANQALQNYFNCSAQPCQPDPDPNQPAQKKQTPNLDPLDPNALIGPAGFGAQAFIQGTGPLSYTVQFENDGTAAAQNVVVTQQLDANLDWSTFQIGSFGFGSISVAVPAGMTQYQTTLAYQNVDGTALSVQMSIDFNVETGLLTTTFTSVDPGTGLAPAGVYDGFLPPDDATHVGEGFVQYTVELKAGLATGATVHQQAAVVFDINGALNTAIVPNTIDAGAPTSTVTALAPTQAPGFTVQWSGQDDAGGSGIATYSIFVSDNGGPFTPFLSNTTAASATFTGVAGHTYGFYSIATDHVGNIQATPASAQTTTNVIAPNGVISGTVFRDFNLDTQQNSGEPALAGQTVYLDLNNNGVLDSGEPTSVTSASGAFSFTGVAPGTLVVRQVLLGGALLSVPAAGNYSLTIALGTTFTGKNFGDVSTSIAVPLTLPPTTPFPAKGNANADYVEAIYRAVLNRNADPGGLASWAGNLTSGKLTRLQVVQGIRNSPEHFGQEIDAFYHTLLGRNADPGGRASWVQQLENGVREEQIAFDFLNSPEYLSKGDKFFIDAMYQSLLGRSFDPAGEASWFNALGDDASGNPTHTPTLSHAQVINDFLFSQESLQRLVEGYYEVFLQRQADPGGMKAWVTELQLGLPFLTIGQQFVSSDEFFNKAAANN